jgi:hypothetical protein
MLAAMELGNGNLRLVGIKETVHKLRHMSISLDLNK